MSNREALRKLSRKMPSRPEIDRIVSGLDNEPDLAAVITGAALVEATLESLLKSKFIYRDSNLVGQLFLNRGPLMDFHSKILVARAFGVITPAISDELHSIKVIRNAFAHSKIPLNFENEIIARETKAFRMRSAIHATDRHRAMADMPDRTWFMLIVKFALIIMQTIEDSPLLADPAIEQVLHEASTERGP